MLKPEDARNAVEDRREQAKAARQQEQLTQDKQKVIRAMAGLERQHPEGNGKTAIRDRSGVRGARLDAALSAGLDDGSFVPCEFHRSNHRTPMSGYQLNTERDAK